MYCSPLKSTLNPLSNPTQALFRYFSGSVSAAAALEAHADGQTSHEQPGTRGQLHRRHPEEAEQQQEQVARLKMATRVAIHVAGVPFLPAIKSLDLGPV